MLCNLPSCETPSLKQWPIPKIDHPPPNESFDCPPKRVCSSQWGGFSSASFHTLPVILPTISMTKYIVTLMRDCEKKKLITNKPATFSSGNFIYLLTLGMSLFTSAIFMSHSLCDVKSHWQGCQISSDLRASTQCLDDYYTDITSTMYSSFYRHYMSYLHRDVCRIVQSPSVNSLVDSCWYLSTTA